MASNYEDIPIDIHYNKLLDWLTSRRHAAADWHKSLLVVRNRKDKASALLNSSVKDIPQLSDFADVEDASLSYFDAFRILETLRNLSAYNCTNVFGQYTHPLTKAWQEVVDIYSKDGVHLAEAAQLILRNVNYEVPALRKQIAKIEQDQQECLRKQSDCNRQSKMCAEKYSTTCTQLGIQGRNPRGELLHLASDISKDLDQIEIQLLKLSDASTFYGNFIKFLHQNGDLPADFLPVLQYILNHGNTTVYQWRTGFKPDVVLPPMSLSSQTHAEPDAGNGEDGADIDWGDMGASDPVDTSGFEVVNVDPEIAVEVLVEGCGDRQEDKSSEVPLEVCFGDEKKIAQGEDAVTVFEGLGSRTKLLDDLAELEVFLFQRSEELRLAEEGFQAYVETIAMDKAPKCIVEVSLNDIAEFLKIVGEVTEKLTSERLTHYFKIRSSEAYLGKLVSELDKISSNGEKAKQLNTLLDIRYRELGELIPGLTKQLAFLARRTLTLKEDVEKQISTKYNNRIVNLIGEICQLSNLIS